MFANVVWGHGPTLTHLRLYVCDLEGIWCLVSIVTLRSALLMPLLLSLLQSKPALCGLLFCRALSLSGGHNATFTVSAQQWEKHYSSIEAL